MQLCQCLPWHFEAVAVGPTHLDNEPFGRGSGLAQPEYFFVEVTFKSSVLVFLDVNGLGPAWEFLEHGDRVAIPSQAIADIHLHIDLGLGAAEENFPGETAVDLCKIERVRMIADLHFVR